MIIDKKKAIREGDLSKAEEDLELLQNKKIRLRPDIDRLCRYYKRLLRGRSNSMDKKKKAKAFLDSYTTTVFSEYETNINEYLESCNAGFRIEEVKTIYPGGKLVLSTNSQLEERLLISQCQRAPNVVLASTIHSVKGIRAL